MTHGPCVTNRTQHNISNITIMQRTKRIWRNVLAKNAFDKM